jgi:hypothetical protein
MAEVPAEGVVPPVVAPAVVVHPDIHAVLAICGFANVSLKILLVLCCGSYVDYQQ